MRRTRKNVYKNIRKISAEWTDIHDVRLGNYAGEVDTGRGTMWVRLENGDPIEVHNTAKLPAIFDLHVRIGRHRNLPKMPQIIRVLQDYPDTSATSEQIEYHHTQHMWNQSDMLPVDRRQIIQLSAQVSDPENFIVQIYGDVIPTPNGNVYVQSQLVDVSSYVVATGALLVNIEFDETGAISINPGDPYDTKLVTSASNYPVVAPGKHRLVTVQFYEGQTELSNDDLRTPMPYEAAYFGDMRQATYDTNGDGTVDNAHELEGHPASDFVLLDDLFDDSTPPENVSPSPSQPGVSPFVSRSDHVHHQESSVGGHAHELARWVSDGGTTFEFPDYVQSITFATDNGSIVDPLVVSLSADRSQIIFDSAITAGHVVTAGYVTAGV